MMKPADRSAIPSDIMLHVPNLIKNELDRLKGERTKFEDILEDVKRATVFGEIKDEPSGADGRKRRHHLDEPMWLHLQDLIIFKLPKCISPFLGAQGEKFTMDVLDRIYPQLQRTVTVQSGVSKLTREVQRYGKPGVQDGEGEQQKPSQKPPQEEEPVQFIQHVGQPLPSEFALFMGSLEDRMAGVQELIKICRRQWDAFYVQADFGSELTKEVNLRKIAVDVAVICDEIGAIGYSAFESISREIRQLAFKIAEAQVQQTMLGRQRRDYAWGYTADRQTMTGMLDYASRIEELERKARTGGQQGESVEDEEAIG